MTLRCRLAAGLVALALASPFGGAVARTLAEFSSAEKEALLARIKAANARFDAGEFGEALPMYASLLAEVELAELHYRTGACLERLGRPAEAAAALRRYLALKPEAADAGRVRFDAERLEALARTPGPSPSAPPASAPPAPPPEPTNDRTLPWALTGTAAALGVGAGVLAWFAGDAVDEANTYDRRAAGHTRARLEGLQDDARDLETATYVVGGIALGAGIAAGVLFLLADPGAPPGADTPNVAGWQAVPGGVRVRF